MRSPFETGLYWSYLVTRLRESKNADELLNLLDALDTRIVAGGDRALASDLLEADINYRCHGSNEPCGAGCKGF